MQDIKDIPGIGPITLLEHIQNLAVEHGKDLALVVNCSGGKDSIRMLGYIRDQFPDIKTYVVMADTGFEHTRPVSAEEWSRQIANRYGLNLHVVRNPNKTYLEMVERRGMFPSKGQRQCTSDLKRGPIQVFIRSLPEKVIISCEGLRAQESPDRAKQVPWKLHEDLSIPERRTKNGRVYQQSRTVYRWLPIFRESLTQVLRWHWDNGVPLHPVYVPEYHVDGTTGGYLRRLSCRVCIFSTDNDIRAIHQHDNEGFMMIARLEQRTGFTMKNGKSLFQIIGQEQTPEATMVEEEQCSGMMM